MLLHIQTTSSYSDKLYLLSFLELKISPRTEWFMHSPGLALQLDQLNISLSLRFAWDDQDLVLWQHFGLQGAVIRCTRHPTLFAIDSSSPYPKFCSWPRIFVSYMGEGILRSSGEFCLVILSFRSEKGRNRVGPKSWLKKKKRHLYAEITWAS